ncbi:hypothetical protein [Okeania sp. SIO1I7]|uniref:hypothetical protein n=1 Tax=Okeania sp. SIO1I7 TaxID=2607772 RepID=UPI0013FC5807|nr:hypothetical protein [Okeania sp. SIO1I7]NET27049.1 hypothetical protein [Okeania sp. SIO1I7]
MSQEYITPYKTYLVSEDGTRTQVEAHSIIIEIGLNQEEIELFLAPPPEFQGILTLRTEAEQRAKTSEESFLKSIVVRPGACNLIHVSIESRQTKTVSR